MSGDTTFNIVTAPNSTAIGVSFLTTSGFKALVRDTNNALEPFSGSFAGNIETRAMTGKKLQTNSRFGISAEMT